MIKKIIRLTLLLVILCICGCAGSKTNEYLKQGSVLQENFKVTIPFEMRKGLMIVEVFIEGEPYNFLVDTGSSTILSKSLADKLQLVPLGAENVGDIFNEEKRLVYGKIENISMGGIDFNSTVGAVLDFEDSVLGCLNIDGILGSNLMRHAVWDFNFKQKTITFTNSENSLLIPENHAKKKMYVGFAGIPAMTIKMNGRKVLNNTIDLGYAGGITLRSKEFTKQKKSRKISKYTTGYGKVLEGAYGQGRNDTFYSFKVDEIEIGKLKLNNRIVENYNGVHNGFGLDFFKDYRIIMNWKENSIKLVEQSTYRYPGYDTYGFNWAVRNNGLYVSALIKGSSAFKSLELNDRILAIGETEYTNREEIQKCVFLGKTLIESSCNEVTIRIERDGKEYNFELHRTNLLP